MAHRKAAITLIVGILSILSATLLIIISGLAMGFCSFNDCTYTTSYDFANILFVVGVALTAIGLIYGGASNDAKGRVSE